MGKHFDTLVELVKHHIGDEEGMNLPNAKNYFVSLINRAALFEFPLNAEEIFPRTGKDRVEYHRYLRDYFEMSEQYGSTLLTPFKLTAIEDKESVVLLDHLEDNEYRVTSCRKVIKDEDGRQINILSILCGDTILNKPSLDKGFLTPIALLYLTDIIDGKKYPPFSFAPEIITQEFAVTDLGTATRAYVEQLVYIMDPENFIIQKESNLSIKQRERTTKYKKKRILEKTIMRPHYICLNQEEVKSFVKRESKEPRPAHPVRGHWKTLMSERYVKMRGQRIYIRQYFTGEGKVIGHGGWTYQVLVKEDPKTIVPYYKSS